MVERQSYPMPGEMLQERSFLGLTPGEFVFAESIPGGILGFAFLGFFPISIAIVFAVIWSLGIVVAAIRAPQGQHPIGWSKAKLRRLREPTERDVTGVMAVGMLIPFAILAYGLIGGLPMLFAAPLAGGIGVILFWGSMKAQGPLSYKIGPPIRGDQAPALLRKLVGGEWKESEQPEIVERIWTRNSPGEYPEEVRAYLEEGTSINETRGHIPTNSSDESHLGVGESVSEPATTAHTFSPGPDERELR